MLKVQRKKRGKDNRDNTIGEKNANLRQNTTHMEYFSIQIRQIGHHENEDGFNDTYMIGETGHQTG